MKTPRYTLNDLVQELQEYQKKYGDFDIEFIFGDKTNQAIEPDYFSNTIEIHPENLDAKITYYDESFY